MKNRETMKKLIDIVLCLDVSGKSFRGHTEKTNDVHKGLFLDIVRLLRKYNPFLISILYPDPRMLFIQVIVFKMILYNQLT